MFVTDKPQIDDQVANPPLTVHPREGSANMPMGGETQHNGDKLEREAGSSLTERETSANATPADDITHLSMLFAMYLMNYE